MPTVRGAFSKKKRNLPPGEPDCLPFPIVAIGASAGDLAALTQLLKTLSPRSGLAIVLIQHLQTEHDSALATLLARATKMPVLEVTDGLAPEPNHVYVIPPNQVMVLRDGALRLSPRASRTSLNFPINAFMTSLATEQGRSAIGVVLSGTGSDGTLGLQAIRTGGGLTFAQDPGSAEGPAMPLNAAAASVDHVGSPRQIAAELLRIARHPYVTPVLTKGEPSDLSTDLNRICLTLGAATGIDFPLYKPATIRRRVARRMALQKISSLAQYAKRLRQDPAEVTALADDIFIHVTSFFRDSDCFQALRRRVFARWRQLKPPPHLRIWVAGCASGEEVYTLAMLLLDEFRDRRDEPKIQIFGTDIQQSAIDRARAGIYPEASLAHVGQTRLKRYFAQVDGGFQVTRALRDLCVFARHDLAKDAPFSRLDLISCRNVLIYMGSELQARALSVFRYALNPDGYLMLGNSESISDQSPHFTAEDATHRIFCRKVSTAAIRSFPLSGDQAHHRGLALAKSLTPDAPIDHRASAEACLLEHYTPSALVVNPDLRIVHFQGNTSPYLSPSTGQPSFNLLKMVRPEFVVALREATAQAWKRGVVVRRPGLEFEETGRVVAVNLEVRPLAKRKGITPDLLIVFEKASSREPALADGRPSRAASRHLTARAARVERELVSARAQLRALITEHEAAQEAMRTANEEIHSTNEELETAKEELQSSNEELITLNEELQRRNAELSILTQDLGNLLAGIDIAVLVLDADLRIRQFTPVAASLLSLIPGDVGRPFNPIASGLLPDWNDVASAVKRENRTFEREVRDQSGRWYSMRIRPCKLGEKDLDRVLVILLDINAIKVASESVQAARSLALLAQARSQAILDSMSARIAVLAPDGVIRFTNAAWRTFAQISGGDPAATGVGVNYLEVCERAHQAGCSGCTGAVGGIRSVLSGEHKSFEQEYACDAPDKSLWCLMTVSALEDDEGGAVVFHVDISRPKKLEIAALTHASGLRNLLESTPGGVLSVNRKGIITFVNRNAGPMFGYRAEDLVGQPVSVLVPEEYRAAHAANHAKYFSNPEPRPMGRILNLEALRRDGTRFPVLISLGGADVAGETVAVAWVEDITERRKSELAVERSERQYRSLFENMREGFAYCQMIHEAGVPTDFLYLAVNPGFESLTGLRGVTGKKVSELIPNFRQNDSGLLEIYARVAAGGGAERFEYFVNSLREWFAVSVNSRETGYFTAFFDVITDRKIAQERLSESESRLRLAIESTQMGTFELVVPTGRRIWSALAKDFVGVAPDEEVTDEIVHARFHPSDLASLYSAVEMSKQPGSTGDFACELRGRKGVDQPYRWVSVRGRMLRDAQGNCQRAVGVMLDITERKVLADAVANSHAEIRALAAQLLTAQEDERRRVARELHDHICQQLAALAMDLTSLATKPPRAAALRQRLGRLQASVTQTADEAAHIAYRMHPSILDDLGLIPSLKDLCRDYSVRYPETTFRLSGQLPDVESRRDIDSTVYRIVQQGLQNVVEHARAAHAVVELALTDNVLRLSVVDDGVGFDPAVTQGRGLGLISMQERAHLVHGSLSFAPNPDGGTRLTLNIPLSGDTLPSGRKI